MERQRVYIIYCSVKYAKMYHDALIERAKLYKYGPTEEKAV